MMTNMTKTTFVQLAAGLEKVCMTVLLATNAKELAAIQNSTGMTIMSNWPFPPATGSVPWTAKQIKAYQQAQRAQLPEAPL
jgi:hypothetical protein